MVKICPISSAWYTDPRTEGWSWSLVLWKATADWLTSSCPFELVDVEGEFEGGAELQAHVFHHHVATQQQECFAVNLLEQREREREKERAREREGTFCM